MTKAHKKIITKYKKRINITFVLYAIFTSLCFLTVLLAVLIAPREASNLAMYIGYGVASVLFLGGSAVLVFAIVPALKKAQAREDLKKYDFAEYKSVAECEIFECARNAQRRTFVSSPFDCSEHVTLKDVKALTEYLEQFSAEKNLECKYLEKITYPDPFFIGSFSDDIGAIQFTAEKSVIGDKTVVDISEIHRAEFNGDGIKIGDEIYPYTEICGAVYAKFGDITDFAVSVRLILFVSDAIILSFALSGRIASVVKRFGIEIENRPVFDYIVSDPERAFIQTALQLNLKKLK